MDAFEALKARRSVRNFKPDPVSWEDLERIVDVGRLAPTAHNEQPWEFVVITDADRRRQVAEQADYGKFIADAPACIVVLSRPTRYYLEDCSAATANMLTAAAALGLGSCWVAGDKKPYADQLVALCGAAGADLKLVALLAIGHADTAPEPNKRALEHVLHRESFQSSA
jgi:nitroreductase